MQRRADGIRILPAQAAQLPAIAALERICFSCPWSEAAFRTQLENPLSLLLAAFRGEELLGYISTQTVAGECSVQNLAVAPQWRRLGIGDALLSAALAYAQAEGCAFMTLEVRLSNTAAKALYARYGFRTAGLRKNYYQKPEEDALILTKYFDNGAEHENSGH